MNKTTSTKMREMASKKIQEKRDTGIEQRQGARKRRDVENRQKRTNRMLRDYEQNASSVSREVQN